MRDPVEGELDDWMSRLARGERGVFDPLFRALYPRALRMARVALPPDQAADAVQSIMIRVFTRAGEFERGRPALPWFYAVAANEVRALGRRAARLRRRTADESQGRAVPGPDDPERLLLQAELRASLQRAIETLDESSVEAIRAMLEQRPCGAVGGEAFRKRVSRAYARLRLLLGGLDAK